VREMRGPFATLRAEKNGLSFVKADKPGHSRRDWPITLVSKLLTAVFADRNVNETPGMMEPQPDLRGQHRCPCLPDECPRFATDRNPVGYAG